MVGEFAFSSTGSISLRGFAAVGFAAIATFLGFTVVILIAVGFTAVSFFTAMAFSDFAALGDLIEQQVRRLRLCSTNHEWQEAPPRHSAGTKTI
jgi:hypothetical protein